MKHISKHTYEPIRIGITQGELSGVSPEIIAKALDGLSLDKTLEIVVIATAKGKKSIEANTKKKISPRVKFMVPDDKKMPAGVKNNETLSCIYYGAKLAKDGKIDAIVTAPIDKNKSSKKYKKFSGHTGFLKDILGARSVLMLMSTPSFKIGIMTEHLAVKDITKQITKKRIIESTKLMHEFLSKTKKDPVIGILALNPHAGDCGLLGKEEIKTIIPAIKQLNKMKIKAVGPIPGDSAFVTDTKDRYDGFIAMYHDQGMIPAKMRGIDSLVNITLGLPIIRTSPGHGVAYDIARTGKASACSMIRAINQAIDMVLANRMK
ncbi:MAG: 4-hydroxythreonine-4-phosphate dehydrogenase PdxA [bacterium]